MTSLRECRWLALLLGMSAAPVVRGQIPKPTDAPPPLSPAESAQRFRVPPGFRLELVAAEPLVREPSGVCWDEQGRLFVCELHGYNLEGQYDIEELNKTGQLDRVVRRIQANERAKEAAKAGTYGTIKRLLDSDGDGRFDRAEVWADRLPPCYGICAARGGLIVACAPDIVFLADRDGDGKAEVREVLFTGFGTGALERGINCPQWGPDDWIYFGSGHGGGTIRGPHLPQPVRLPNTDFRIKADGSAIEPVSGSTHTIGLTFTEEGDRFVVSTRTPGIFVAPLPWPALARNPDVATPPLEVDASPDQRVYPTSRPHPWRTRRAEDPGFAKYYTERYGVQESAPNGYFTSACSPLVYQDTALPGLHGQLLACEPAQNLVHRAIVERDGARLKLRRAPGEEKAEFLTSSDPWFHPIALTHAPDGSIWIVDFYREIIEDYSAIPRYLQQQYGLVHGKDHGRIWRLTHQDAQPAPAADMPRLNPAALAREAGGANYWRRQTARRLLIEKKALAAVPLLARQARESREPGAILNALVTLDGLGVVTADLLDAMLTHAEPGVRRQALRLADPRFDEMPRLLERALTLGTDKEPMVRLQVALSLGESRDPRVLPALARLARQHGDELWMVPAVLSSLSGRGGVMLGELLSSDLGKARGLLEPLCAGIGARRQPRELAEALTRIAAIDNREVQSLCLRGLRSRPTTSVVLPEDARGALQTLTRSADADVRTQAQGLVKVLKLEAPAERQARLTRAAREVGDIQLSVEARLAAVAELATEDDATGPLFAALASGTPRVREAILGAAFSRRDRFPALLDALEKKVIPTSALTAVQRTALLDDRDPAIRRRAAPLLSRMTSVNDDLFQRYARALQGKRDLARGEQVFREKCANCHQAHGLGTAVGPDLSAEFQRAEETILRDILAPGDVISPGYATYSVVTTAGQVFSGILASESPTSVTLRQPEGKEQVILRKDIEELRVAAISLMPEDLAKTLTPEDAADAIAWLRRPPPRR